LEFLEVVRLELTFNPKRRGYLAPSILIFRALFIPSIIKYVPIAKITNIIKGVNFCSIITPLSHL